jgi:thiamine-monophosphate kinase
LNEAEIIQLLSKKMEINGIGIGDDIAFLKKFPLAGESLVVASDIIAENTHFKLKWSSPVDLAYKLVETNVSDFYCKGTKPSYAVFQLAVKDSFLPDLKIFLNTVKKRLQFHGIQLIGGDTIKADRCLFGLTLLGSAESIVGRKSASLIPKGSLLVCLGELGGSSFGLKGLKQNKENIHLTSYLRPESKMPKESIMKKAYCSIDQSDSFIETINYLSTENNVLINVYLDQIPVAKGVPYSENLRELRFILGASEDLAIVAIFPKSMRKKIVENNFTLIGKVSGSGQKENKLNFYWKDRIISDLDFVKTYKHFG